MRAAVILALAGLAGAVRVAHADDNLAEAKRLEAALEYEQALAIVERVIAHGGASPSELADLHMMAGRLAAGLDRMMVAEEHFAKLLALVPNAALSDGTSPKISAPFYAARSRSVPLRVAVTTNQRLIAIVADPDPLGLVAGIAVRAIAADGHPLELSEPHALHLELPDGAHAIQIVALDRDGNRVWLGPTLPAPTGAPQNAKPDGVHRTATPVPAPPSPPILRRWTTWTIASSVAFVAGGACAWRFGVAQDRWNQARATPGQYDYSYLLALEDRGHKWGLAANISFGVAAGAALVAAITYFTRPEQPVAVTPTPNGLAVGASF